MAEGVGRESLPDYHISSAGTKPEEVNSYAIKVMNQIGIDISSHYSKRINNKEFKQFDIVITLCGDAKDNCPIISSEKHIHWDIEDPAKFKGNKEELIKKYSKIRDIIINKIKLLKVNLDK